MKETFQNLIGLAFRQGPAEQANTLIHDMRQQIKADQGMALSYEIVLTGHSQDALRQTVAPRLALYLRSKRLAVNNCRPVFLSIFLEDTLYFVHAADFYQHIRLAERLDEETFDLLARTWEETGRAVAGALPAPKSPPSPKS